MELNKVMKKFNFKMGWQIEKRKKKIGVKTINSRTFFSGNSVSSGH